jgi:two-component system, cell cycle sensor histidine kinase and response regulator CckA
MSQPTTNNSPAPPLIFVVDDEPMLLELAVVILEPLGYQMKTFRDPEQALQAFSAARPRPDLLITDFAMHNMTGLDLIREIRHVQPNQKILMLSGTVDASVYRNAPEKPDRFLAKPYQARQLAELVLAMLEAERTS